MLKETAERMVQRLNDERVKISLPDDCEEDCDEDYNEGCEYDCEYFVMKDRFQNAYGVMRYDYDFEREWRIA